MVPYGGQVGTIACVGKSMGEGNSKNARIYIKVATVIMLVVDFFLAFFLVIYKDIISSLFTDNKVVQSQLATCFEQMALLLIFHGIQFIEAGAIKGLGM